MELPPCSLSKQGFLSPNIKHPHKLDVVPQTISNNHDEPGQSDQNRQGAGSGNRRRMAGKGAAFPLKNGAAQASITRIVKRMNKTTADGGSLIIGYNPHGLTIFNISNRHMPPNMPPKTPLSPLPCDCQRPAIR
jgi:hypothetical protein